MKKWLGFIFVCLMVFAAFYQISRPNERGIVHMNPMGVSSSLVDRIVVSGANQVTLHKKKEAWFLEHEQPADNDTVVALLLAFQRVESSNELTINEPQLAEYGLDGAHAHRIQMFQQDKTLLDVTLGHTQAHGTVLKQNNAYFKIGTIDVALYANNNQGFARKKLFEDTLDEITRVEIVLHDQQPIVIESKDKTYHISTSTTLPHFFTFDSNAAKQYVASLASLRMRTQVNKEMLHLEQYGLDDAHADRITWDVTHENTQAHRILKLGHANEQGHVYFSVTDRPGVFLMQAGLAKSFRKSIEFFRDMRFFKEDSEKITAIHVFKPREQFRFERDMQNATWRLVSSIPTLSSMQDIDVSQVAALVSRAALLKGIATAPASISLAKAGLVSPKYMIVLESRNHAPVQIHFGRSFQKDDHTFLVYASYGTDPTIYLMTQWEFDHLMLPLRDFFAPTQAAVSAP